MSIDDADDVAVGVAAARIDRTANVAEDLAECLGALPGDDDRARLPVSFCLQHEQARIRTA